MLAARLLGPLKMTGKQTGWIYATLPIACIVSPLVSGLLADKYMNTEWILAICHAIGAVLMFLAVRQQTFKRLFLVMLLYSLCYGATLPLVNAVLFAHVSDATQGLVFIWAPIAWALVGYFLTGWRTMRGGEGDGSDCLMLAAVLSVLMAVACYLAPATPPTGRRRDSDRQSLRHARPARLPDLHSHLAGRRRLDAVLLPRLSAVHDRYGHLGQERARHDGHRPGGASHRHVFPAGTMVETVGFKWTLTIGAGFWLLMYLVYVGTKPRWLIVMAQTFHGLAYVFFMIVGQIYAGEVGPHIPARCRP